jgi:hypothetical protein
MVYEVMPLIDNLTTFVQLCLDNTNLFSSVRASSAGGLFILDKYYAKTDDSIMYRVAMSE